MKEKPAREGPLKVNLKFDEAIRRALTVKPPHEGWEAYEKKIWQQRKKRRAKPAA